MDIQAAAGRTESTHHRGGVVRLQARRNFAQSELPRVQHQFLGERAVPLTQQRRDFARRGLHAAKPPGIFGASTARKNSSPSSNSPNASSAKANRPRTNGATLNAPEC